MKLSVRKGTIVLGLFKVLITSLSLLQIVNGLPKMYKRSFPHPSRSSCEWFFSAEATVLGLYRTTFFAFSVSAKGLSKFRKD